MKKQPAIDQRLRRRLLPFLLFVITLLLGALLWNRIEGVRKQNFEVATEGARNIFHIIVLTRQWNAEHGGVYAFESDKTTANSYLDHPERELELKDKRKLVLLNPAYMARQIAELAEKDPRLHLRLHITSLRPIRPENTPDAWEALALGQFEQGLQEIASVEQMEGRRYLRYMAPLQVTEACMKCHAKQGYRLGDIRGGISVSLQFAGIEATIRKEILATVINHAVSYGLLLIITWGLVELLARRWRALDDSIETLQETRNELVENEKMASLGRLVAGFAHEINTPVGVAVGAISHGDDTILKLQALLSKDEVTEQELAEELDYLQQSHALALSNLRRAAELVQRFKRTSIDRGSAQKREYQLAELIRDVLMTLQNVLKHASVEVEVHCAERLKLYGTPGLLEQVLTNLITNSVSHGFEDGARPGRIVIKAWQADGRLMIDYRDNGVGMSEEVRQRAFEPFFTTRRGTGGSGLGLYVTYNIVSQQLGGSIQIISVPKTGVCFYIECPIERTP